jgi:hypothetical protein
MYEAMTTGIWIWKYVLLLKAPPQSDTAGTKRDSDMVFRIFKKAAAMQRTQEIAEGKAECRVHRMTQKPLLERTGPMVREK